QQLLGEAEDLDAQVGRLDVLGVEARVAGQFRRDRGALLALEAIAEQQGRRVALQRELLDALHERRERQSLQLVVEPPVVMRGGGVGRQEQQRRQVVAGREARGGEVEDRRDQDQAVEVQAVSLL